MVDQEGRRSVKEMSRATKDVKPTFFNEWVVFHFGSSLIIHFCAMSCEALFIVLHCIVTLLQMCSTELYCCCAVPCLFFGICNHTVLHFTYVCIYFFNSKLPGLSWHYCVLQYTALFLSSQLPCLCWHYSCTVHVLHVFSNSQLPCLSWHYSLSYILCHPEKLIQSEYFCCSYFT